MTKAVYLYILLFAVTLTSCASKFSKVLKSKDNEYKYKMAENYYAQKKYAYAQQLFDELFPYVKGTSRYEDLFYKNAYSYYYQKDYLNAENIFKTYTENFPGSARAEECEYMRAYCFYKQSPKLELDQTNTSKAMSLMQAFINQHPQSAKTKEATELLELCRSKLEEKEYVSATLYYDLGYYRAAAIALSTLMEDYPESDKSDDYKMLVIRSYYKYAGMSFSDKQQERYEKVISEAGDFAERFPQSKYLKEVNDYKTLSINSIKNIKNEQAKTATQR
ncbi:outer membrane protein assembly factor BamD [Deminuibacter soli]|uniref:Outer membrane protein assembly factor BamD n=1 Tax=Deminuibacter soli TaxID=2291815 RepID=A0A3E1NDK9_9BACT|nr:outer membrane protein assembly factor BamD [Deminuibacter soli]RFM26046.1 outer membrane protein assembly factor BamD [Deminuibacter soli]